MKLAVYKDEEVVMAVYQHGDAPILGDDVVITGTTVVKCLHDLATWIEQRYGNNY